MHKGKGDIAAEQRAAVVGNAGEQRIGERADGGNGGDAQHQRGEENAEAGKAAAQFPPRQPNSENKHGHSYIFSAEDAGNLFSVLRESAAPSALSLFVAISV